MWEIVFGVLGAAVIAVGGWLFNRAINKWDKLSDRLQGHETKCNERWKENAMTLAVHGEKLSNLETGQERMNDKLDRILGASPAQS